MESKITEEEAHEMDEFKKSVGCDASAEPDWSIHFDKVVEVVLS
jgi:hypothetical protein